jgi:hypothetical protein
MRKIFNQGSVLVYSLVVLTLLLGAALTVAGIAVLERKGSISTESSGQAFAIADSGAEIMLQKISNDSTLTDIDSLAGKLGLPCSFSSGEISNDDITGGSYQAAFYDGSDPPSKLECDDPVSGINKIKVTGNYSGTTRSIEVPAGGLIYDSGWLDMNNNNPPHPHLDCIKSIIDEDATPGALPCLEKLVNYTWAECNSTREDRKFKATYDVTVTDLATPNNNCEITVSLIYSKESDNELTENVQITVNGGTPVILSDPEDDGDGFPDRYEITLPDKFTIQPGPNTFEFQHPDWCTVLPPGNSVHFGSANNDDPDEDNSVYPDDCSIDTCQGQHAIRIKCYR